MKNSFMAFNFFFILISVNSYGGPTCHKLLNSDANVFFELENKLTLKYGNHKIVSLEKKPPIELSAGEDARYRLDILNSTGKKVGFLVADIQRENILIGTDAVFSVRLPPILQKKGLFRSFVEFIVNRFNVTLVNSFLTGDNSKIFLDMVREEKLSKEDAYFQTPSGKIFKSLGFKLQKIEVDFDDLELPEIVVDIIKYD